LIYLLSYQTLFATGKASSIKPLLITDTLTLPAAGNSKVRFINLSPDAPAFDISKTNGPKIFSGISYRKSTGFIELPEATYNLTVSVTSSGGLQSYQVPPVTIVAGEFYTVFASGFVLGTGKQAISAQVIENIARPLELPM